MSETVNQAQPEDLHEPIDPEAVSPQEEGQALERIPETITQLAVPGAEGRAIIESRKQIIELALRCSIWLTFPLHA